MYALTVTSRKQLERATLRAQAEKLRMEEVVFGIYKVWGSTGNLYLIGIEPAIDGGYDVCCTCPTQNTFCKHVSTVMPHYQMREKDMLTDEQVRAAHEAAPAFPPVEIAKYQAEKALAVVAQSVQEIEEFIAESKSMDRHCPACGLVQPDDDSTGCWLCGASLDQGDDDQALADKLRCTVCSSAANVFFTDGERLCWDHLQEKAEDEAEKDAVRNLKQDEREELAASPRKCINRNCTSCADAGCSGYCVDCYNGMMQDRKDHEDLFGFVAPARANRVKEEW
jgi:hypothetical protein